MTTARKIVLILLPVAAMILVAGCKDEDDTQLREQEERYFELYLASNYPDETPRPSGLYFIEFSQGTGESPGEEDWVLMNYVATMVPEDDIFDTSLENVAKDNNLYSADVLYGPFKARADSWVEGVTEGLQLMREGGRATMFFQSDLGFGTQSTPVGAYQSLKYEVELLEVLGDIEAYEQQRFMSYVDTIQWTDTIHDPETDVILYYITFEEGKGDTIVDGSNVELIYTGTLFDGRVFDQNLSTDDPFEFEAGGNDVIKGWELVMPGMQEGWKGKLVIPYQLAYGETEQYATVGTRRFRSLPPYENLIYEVEILEVTDPKTAAD
jgi:FKBP-type peptidyl-prolyl cis-trans isomerase FkpA